MIDTQYKTQTVLITGATGFVGQALCQLLLKQGFRVIALGRHAHYTIHHERLQYQVIQSLWDQSIDVFLNQAQVVIHLAAKVHQMGKVPTHEYERENSELTKHLASLAVKHDVRQFIFLSSIKVNGELTTDKAFNEQTVVQPHSPYGRSKWFAEQAVQTVAQESSMAWTIIRPLVYGPGVKANFLRLLRFADLNFPLPLQGIQNQRSFIAIDNLVDFISHCIDHPNAKNQIFCVADSDSISTSELVQFLQKIRKGRTRLYYLPLSFLTALATCLGKRAQLSRLTDSLVIDIGKARRLLDWYPKLQLKDAMQEYFSNSATKTTSALKK